MFISEIYANGFRCFGAEIPLMLKLWRGLNILVGPNDTGKTAIIDAPRYVLWTRGDDFVRLDANDFHVQSAGQNGLWGSVGGAGRSLFTRRPSSIVPI